jgi:hypothetical protein
MTWYPHFKLYASNGSTLVYTFNFIQNENGPQDPFNNTEITGFRGQGSLIIPGSLSAWDLTLDFCLVGTDYQDLISKMDSLESTIVANTPYILKIDRTPSTTKDYNVKRIVPIQWQSSYRLKLQKGIITLRVNSW